ncbi:transmembrane protein 145 isoform X3 [Heptranchias perlo]|uniref:transmembrane protein 145 isoform X3 n=1 Tax=Heptranchias perlo TaxID=212740 RepID=UPI00355A02CC
MGWCARGGMLSCILLFTICLSLVSGKYEAGNLETDKKWVFLTKFCFLSEKGQISYHIRYPKEKHNVNLLFYYDEKTQWPSVYKNSSKDCWSKEAVAASGSNQLLNLTQSFVLSGCQGGGITLEYKITMSNGKTLWRRHFSANQIGILEVHILSVLLFIIALGVCICFARYLKKRHLLHSSYQMLMLSVGTEVLGHFFLCIHLGIYALNGVGCESVKIIGRLLLVISYLLLVPMLLLMSHGFTITRTKIHHSSAVTVCLLVVTFALMYLWFFIDEKHLIDPGKVQTVLESSIGYAVTALQFLTAFWFSQSTYKIMQHHPEKRPFYLLFFPAFTLWFFAVPVSNLFGQFIIVNWKRERIMNTVSLFLKFYVYAVMLFLTRPFPTNIRFPYHIDTSRIALMRYASESQENFEKLGHHMYRNISVTSFINDDSTAPNASGSTMCGPEEDTDLTRDLLERTKSQIDSRFGFIKKQGL